MSHLTTEEIVAYLAGEAENEVSLEEHLFDCAQCTSQASRLSEVTAALQQEIQPILDHAQLELLRARGLRIQDNPVEPGANPQATFHQDTDILLHRLRGLALEHAVRVDVTVRVESTGQILLEAPDARFDAHSGEVLIACQRHFSHYPPDTQMEVRVQQASAETVKQYSVFHVFLS